MNFITITLEKISDTCSLFSDLTEIRRTILRLNPKSTTITKNIANTCANETNPKLSTPSTLTKYGRVTRGINIFVICKTYKEAKFSISSLYFMIDVLTILLS